MGRGEGGMTERMFSNRMAAVLWGFALIWVTMLALFTYVMVRDGAPEGYSAGVMWAIIAVFWLAGAGLAAYAAAKPCFFVTIGSDGLVRFLWRYPHRSEREAHPAADLAPPTLVETVDDEGAPYFQTDLTLPGGRTFRLAEGHDRARCEAAIARFEHALRGAAGGGT